MIRDFGRKGTSLTWGIVAPRAGATSLRFHVRNSTGKTLPFTLRVGSTAAQAVSIPPTGDAWQGIDLPVTLAAGANRVVLSGTGETWDQIQVESAELP